MTPDGFGYGDKVRNVAFVVFALFLVWLLFGPVGSMTLPF